MAPPTGRAVAGPGRPRQGWMYPGMALVERSILNVSTDGTTMAPYGKSGGQGAVDRRGIYEPVPPNQQERGDRPRRVAAAVPARFLAEDVNGVIGG